MKSQVEVAKVDQVKPGQSHLVRIKDQAIALFNIEGTIFGLDNTCPHSRGPLVEGRVSGHKVRCPWHGAQFDITTGACLAGPATQAVKTYVVHVENGSVFIELP
jgi:nitrite reductase/ring-hydroxylating ferredoxin subunit